jgi:hypothetical protein
VSTIVVSPKANATASGTALLDAVTTACGNSPNLYLLRVEPGTYDLGISYLGLCPTVDIEGSGEDITSITASGEEVVREASLAFTSVGEVRALTISKQNAGFGAFFHAGVSWHFRHVTFSISGEGNPTAITARGPGIMDNVTMTATGTVQPIGVDVESPGVRVNNSSITVVGPSNGSGFFVWSGDVSVRNTTVQTPSGGNDLWVNGGATAEVYGSLLKGATSSISAPGGHVMVYQSVMAGTTDATGGGTAACYYSVGATNTLSLLCQ